jgi:VIT1/CCC1 family predicted Fe2+/Mn2+ transporter
MIHIDKFSIGGTAAIITSMGLIAGLTQGYNARASIITGLLIVAIADNISDSFSIHIYKESQGSSRREVNISTFGNFMIRLLTVLTFICIVLLFPPTAAFIISSVWGLVLLTMLSYIIAKNRGTRLLREIFWHLTVALLVIICSKLLGTFIVKTVAHS